MKGPLKPDRKPRIYRGEDGPDFLPSFLFWKNHHHPFIPTPHLTFCGWWARPAAADSAALLRRPLSWHLPARAHSCAKQNTSVTLERFDRNPLTSFHSSPVTRFPQFPPSTLYALLVFLNQDGMRLGQVWRRSVPRVWMLLLPGCLDVLPASPELPRTWSEVKALMRSRLNPFDRITPCCVTSGPAVSDLKELMVWKVRFLPLVVAK